MTTYRRYSAGYDFQARDSTELSMKAGDTLRVSLKPNGEWPNHEKFMKGVNERTGEEGDFPGGAYVEFVEEFTEPDQDALYDEPPPPTPPRRGPSASKISEPVSEPGAPHPPHRPRPQPRIRSAVGLKAQEVEAKVAPVSPPPGHNWMEVTFHLPIFCAACEDLIWGSLNHGYKCTECLAVCHSHCVDHVISTQECIPVNDPAMAQQLEYAHAAVAYTDWPESCVQSWMQCLMLTDYAPRFREAGILRGADLSRIDDSFLEENMGIVDEAHRQIILECFDELCRGSSSTMPSLAVHRDDTDGRHPNRLSGIFSMHRSPSIQSIQSLLGGLGKKRGDTQVCGHEFHKHTFSTPHWCDVCGRFLWGLVMQGVKCRDCGMKVHRMCMTEGIFTCEEWRSRRAAIVSKPSYGLELDSVFDCQTQKAPTVVLKCIEAVESRGLRSEGIYRVSAVKSSIISLRLELDEDPSQVDILDSRWDHNTFAGALKLYLRELPDPVFTYQLYEHFVSVGRMTSVDTVYAQLRPMLDRLPPAHRSTLDFLVDHLKKVSTYESQNKMSTRNLALLFGPTLLRPPPEDIQKLIENSEVHCRVLEILIQKTTLAPPPIIRRAKPELPVPQLPPRPTPRPLSAINTAAIREEIDARPTSGRGERVLPPIPVDTEASDIYMVNTPGGRGPPLPPTPTPRPSTTPQLPLEQQGWYWAGMSKEEVAAKLRDTEDGAFLVRDSSRTQGEYTLTVRKAGTNKLIRIIFSKGKYGFSEPTVFNSVPDLVEHYQREPLTKYNPRLDITLSKPVSRFAKVDDDEDDIEEEDREATTDSLIIKLQDLSQIFDQKNRQYLDMEAAYEECKEDVQKAKCNVAAKSLWLEMIKEQLKIPSDNSHLSKNDKDSLIRNAKLLATRMREAQKSFQQAGRHLTETNMQFRTMDKDINTIRPELMRLQWEKEQYTIKLHGLGMTQEEINQRVKESALTEAEDIYGTLYGTFEPPPEQEEDPYPESATPTFVENSGAPPPALPVRDYTPRGPSTPLRRMPPPTEELQQQLLPPVRAQPRDRSNSPNRASRAPAREERLPPPLPTEAPHVPGRHNSIGTGHPHLRKETWYCEVDRVKAGELLKNRENGTFLVRPSAKQRVGASGETHTHSIDIVYNGTKHLKVVRQKDKYGFSVPCNANSLEELIIRYSELSLEQHNTGLTTTLKYPVHGERFS